MNLTVGQKVWSIQLGDCEVVSINYENTYPVLCMSGGVWKCKYNLQGLSNISDKHPSLFLSNPFEKVQGEKSSPIDDFVAEMKFSGPLIRNYTTDRAQLLTSLFNIYVDSGDEIKKIAKEKLLILLQEI